MSKPIHVPNPKDQSEKETLRALAKAKLDKIKLSLQEIGPERAKELLERGNKYNRDVSVKHAQHLATKMNNDDCARGRRCSSWSILRDC